MSQFTVKITINIDGSLRSERPKVTEETYTTWGEADEAFCAWRAVAALRGSRVEHVELIEHKLATTKATYFKGQRIVEETPVAPLRATA